MTAVIAGIAFQDVAELIDRKFGSVMSCTPSSFLLELAGEGVESGSMEEILSAPMEEADILDGFAQMRAMLNS